MMITTTIPDNSGKVAKPFGPVLLQFRLGQRVYYARGKPAQVLFLMINNPGRLFTTDFLGRRIKSVHTPHRDSAHLQLEAEPARNRNAAEQGVYKAISDIREALPNLLYSGGWGKGWRIASDQHPQIVWQHKDLPTLIESVVPLVNPRLR